VKFIFYNFIYLLSAIILGRSVSLERGDDHKFTCPCGAFSDANPEIIRNHVVSAHRRAGSKGSRDDEDESSSSDVESVSDVLTGVDPIEDSSVTFVADGPESVPTVDPLFQQYDLIVEPRLRIIYCVRCGEAILPEHARSHALTHFPHVPAALVFEKAVRSLEFDGIPRVPSSPIAPIPSLKHVSGFKCTICSRLASSRRVMQQHHKDDHPGLGSKENSKEVTMHRIYEYRGRTVLVETDESLGLAIPGSAFESFIRKPGRERSRQASTVYQPPNDPKRVNNFLYLSKWSEIIRGCDTVQLRALVAPPTGRYIRLAKSVFDYITYVDGILPKLSNLFLRLIHSEK
jgi:Orsellinic acid/F9775 biosynthesis cluster protein D